MKTEVKILDKHPEGEEYAYSDEQYHYYKGSKQIKRFTAYNGDLVLGEYLMYYPIGIKEVQMVISRLLETIDAEKLTEIKITEDTRDNSKDFKLVRRWKIQT